MPRRKRKNIVLEQIKIEKIGYWWVGVITLQGEEYKKNDGKKLLIKGWALPGSIVDVLVTRSKKDFLEGRITKIHNNDPQYADCKPFCKHFFHIGTEQGSEVTSHKIGCGGCKWQVMRYEQQLKLKETIVKEQYQASLDSGEVNFLPIVGSPLEKGYRNKIEFSFGKFIQGNSKWDREAIESHWNLGFHKQWAFSKIVDIDTCGLIPEDTNNVFEYCKKLCQDSGLPVYDQMKHTGFFRHLAMRHGLNTSQILVNIVVADKYFISDGQKKPRKDLQEKFKQDEFLQEHVTTFVITYNNGLADVVRGPEISTEILWGDGSIYEKLIFGEDRDLQEKKQDTIEASFRISPFSFFQTNTLGAQQLFCEAAKIVGNVQWTILDLYCGTGTIGLSFLKMGMGKDLIWIEIVEDAIQDAWHNAKINHLSDNSFFVASPAEKAFEDYPEIQEKLQNLDLVILDPPREGLHKNVIKFLCDIKKDRNFKLLYISCNPVTMARDIELLQANESFKLDTLEPVDLFPQTHHIECIGKLN